MASSDSSERLMSALRRFQRRLRLRAFVRVLPIASASALALIDALVVTSRLDGMVLPALAGAMVLAILAAIGLAILMTPSPTGTARLVDDELRLQDRAVSALQFAESDDPVARLVVSDAAARLDSIAVSGLPLRVPMAARWLAAATLAVSALIFITRDPADTDTPVVAGSAGAAAESGARAQGHRSNLGAPGAPGHVRDGRAAAPPSPTASPSPPAGEPTTPSIRASNARTGGVIATDSSSAVTPRPSASGSPAPPDGRPAAQGGTSASAGRGSGDAPRNAAANLSAAGRGASAAAARDGAGGGTAGGALLGNTPGTVRSESTTAGRHTAAYAVAYARAEAASSADRVPPALRTYVRAYFTAIRPGPSQ